MRALAVVAAACVMAVGATAPADARKRDRDYGWNNQYDRWENRRDARRAGVIAGAVASGIARSAAASNADEHCRECIVATGYDEACERRYCEERRDARRSGRAVGVTAVLITREIVRD